MRRTGLFLALGLLLALPTSGWVPSLECAHRTRGFLRTKTLSQQDLVQPVCCLVQRQPGAARLRSATVQPGGSLEKAGTCGIQPGVLRARRGEGVDPLDSDVEAQPVESEGRDEQLGSGKGSSLDEWELDAAIEEGQESESGFNPDQIRQKTIQALDSIFAGCKKTLDDPLQHSRLPQRTSACLRTGHRAERGRGPGRSWLKASTLTCSPRSDAGWFKRPPDPSLPSPTHVSPAQHSAANHFFSPGDAGEETAAPDDRS
jgi:hypothetical protein